MRSIQKEKARIDFMLTEYERQLAVLPKGSIARKKVGAKEYFYLRYRDGKKVITDYIGKDVAKVENLHTLIKRRRHVEKMIAFLKREHALASRMLEV